MYVVLNGEKIQASSNWKVNDKYEYAEFKYSEFVKKPHGYYIWRNGEIIKNPEFEDQEKEKNRQRILQLSMTKREMFLALYEGLGLTPDDIRSRINDEKSLIEFDYATEYYRGNPLVEGVGELLGLSCDDLDYLFEHRELKKWENQ